MNKLFNIFDICLKIIDDLKSQEKYDPYKRKFNYDPFNDVITLFEHSIDERIHKKDVIQILTDIHLLKWSLTNDNEWFVIC